MCFYKEMRIFICQEIILVHVLDSVLSTDCYQIKATVKNERAHGNSRLNHVYISLNILAFLGLATDSKTNL